MRLQRRDPACFDAILVHRGGVEIGDLPFQRSWRRVCGDNLLDHLTYDGVGLFGQFFRRADRQLVRGQLV